MGNNVTDIYLDEVKMDSADDISFISTADIALIKVFPPPAFLGAGTGEGGAIAVYTKRGIYNENKRKNVFLVKGYTGSEAIWK